MLGALIRNLRRRETPQAAGPEPAVRRLHLGCGKTILQGWINLDDRRLPGVDVVADLDRCRSTALPFPDASINEFLGGHVLEHLRDPLALMQELHRIATPGAKAVFRVPHGASDAADEDPTHVRRYYPNSFLYFSQLAYFRADYGYTGDWEPERVVLAVSASRHAGKSRAQLIEEIETMRNVALGITAVLRAVKPARAPGTKRPEAIKAEIQLVESQ